MNDRRTSNRLEQFSVSARFEHKGNSYSGYVLDSSDHGIAVTTPKGAKLPEEGSAGSIYLKTTRDELSDVKEYEAGPGEITRIWMNDDDWGYAMKLRELITTPELKKTLFSGIRQQHRIEQQTELAIKEIDSLETEVRSLKDCVLKIFMLVLTFGAALASSYLALVYHGVYTKQIGVSSLSFWRTMIAVFPGLLSIVAGLVVSYKVIHVIRAESFLSILKSSSIKNQYPREYRGWQAAVRKMRICWKSKLCKECHFKLNCGKLKLDEEKWIRDRSMFDNPSLNLFYTVIYGSLGLVWMFSTSVVLYELAAFQWGTPVYSIISCTVLLLFIILATTLGYFLWHLRKGKYAAETARRVWLDLLEKCPHQP